MDPKSIIREEIKRQAEVKGFTTAERKNNKGQVDLYITTEQSRIKITSVVSVLEENSIRVDYVTLQGNATNEVKTADECIQLLVKIKKSILEAKFT